MRIWGTLQPAKPEEVFAFVLGPIVTMTELHLQDHYQLLVA